MFRQKNNKIKKYIYIFKKTSSYERQLLLSTAHDGTFPRKILKITFHNYILICQSIFFLVVCVDSILFLLNLLLFFYAIHIRLSRAASNITYLIKKNLLLNVL